MDALNNQDDPDDYYAHGVHAMPETGRHASGNARTDARSAPGRNGGGTLAGVDGIRIWHDQALFKPPFGNPTALASGQPVLVVFVPRSRISLWVALDDATLGNGCMWYVPGSQKTATFENVGHRAEPCRPVQTATRNGAKSHPVACPCTAGSAVFHNGLTAHGAGAT